MELVQPETLWLPNQSQRTLQPGIVLVRLEPELARVAPHLVHLNGHPGRHFGALDARSPARTRKEIAYLDPLVSPE